MEEAQLRRLLAELQQEHRDLDAGIVAMQLQARADRLQIQRMKKRKLSLKDQIARVEALLLPDIIA